MYLVDTVQELGEEQEFKNTSELAINSVNVSSYLINLIQVSFRLAV